MDEDVGHLVWHVVSLLSFPENVWTGTEGPDLADLSPEVPWSCFSRIFQ